MKRKQLLIILTSYLLLLLIIPSVILLPARDKAASPPKNIVHASIQPDETLTVAVFREQKQQVEKLDIERYVEGVVASEMPASFETEALKAQALAARTYVVRLMSANKGELPMDADVTDTVAHQVFKSDDELKTLWQDDYTAKKEKITKAVAATKGEIITYEGSPITATFFSTSNGKTENAGDYWTDDIPYLKSVDSPWDETESDAFLTEQTIPLTEFQQKLGITLSKDDIGTINERTDGNRVKSITIGGKTFTGREVREKLDLRSSDFHWMLQKDTVLIQTKGFGHGVGMSQYGANGMAKQGKSYTDIIHHYFTDVTIEPYDLPQLASR